jgi:hypothetical protein
MQRLGKFKGWSYIGFSCLMLLVGLSLILEWVRAAQIIMVIGCTIASAVLAVLGPRGFFAILSYRFHGAPGRPSLLVVAVLTCEFGAMLILSLGLELFGLPDPTQPITDANQALLWFVTIVLAISGAAALLGLCATAILSLVLRVPHASD